MGKSFGRQAARIFSQRAFRSSANPSRRLISIMRSTTSTLPLADPSLFWAEATAEAKRGRHLGFLSFNVIAGGPGSLALAVIAKLLRRHRPKASESVAPKQAEQHQKERSRRRVE